MKERDKPMNSSKTLLALLSISLALPNVSYSQFNKYKSRTKFKGTNKNAPANNNPSALNDKNAKDFFGRGTGIKNADAAAKDSKYVNLNPETAFGPEVVPSFDFPNANLLDLTKHMQKLTGLNIIFDKDIKGKVTILSPSPITVGDAWKAYLTALNMNGFALVKSGAFYKVVKNRDIRYNTVPIYTGEYTPNTENYIMRIIPLKHISGNEVTRTFRPFMSRFGRLLEMKQTNTIIALDTGANVNRLMRLINFLDVKGYEESLHIIKVKHSSAEEIAKMLETILKGKSSGKFSSRSKKGQSSGVTKIIAERRTNSLIVMATATGIVELRELISKLDVKLIATGSGKVHVYYLNHGNAESLSKTLSTLVSGSSSSKSKSRLSRRRSSSKTSSLFNNDVKITADKDNNALVVTASPTDWLTLKEVIKKLDIPRNQVFVEGMVMETSVSKGDQFGVSIVGAYGSGETQRAGFTGGSTDLFDLMNLNVANLGGLFLGGGIGREVSLTLPDGSEKTVNSITGLIQAVAADNNTNILSTPQLLILDNTDGEFEVGEEVPIPKIQNSSSGTSTQSVETQSVTMKIKIKPQINKASRFIKLKISQSIKDFSDRTVANGAGGVGTTVRNANTEVVVRDKDTIAMGGLMRDKESQRINKVPLLGDIPVLGWLFKKKTKSREKVNMIFFLTPRIISPYEKESTAVLKDVLNRRSAHLKNVLGEDDPQINTAKGLYKKAGKQAQGPLYDKEDAQKYLKINEGKVESEVTPLDFVDPSVPDYDAIKKKANNENAETPKQSQTQQPAQAKTADQGTNENLVLDEGLGNENLVLPADDLLEPVQTTQETAQGE